MVTELNKADILENFMDDEELLLESIDLFIDRAASRMSTLKEAVAAKDSEVIMIEAHTMKGMIGIFSTAEAFESAKKIELKMRDKNLNEIENDFNDFQTKMNSLVEALTQWRLA